MFNQIFGEEGSKRISRWAAISLVLFSVFLAVKIIGDFKKLPNMGREVYPQSTISVSGSGEVYAIPDVATFSFSIIETGSTVKQAQEKADQKTNRALAAVKEAGIEDRDVKTTGYNVYPKYEWSNAVCPASPMGGVSYCPPGKQTLTGYEVNQTITVKVRDIEKAGDLITKVGSLAVSNISGVEFTVDKREDFVAQARAQAITEAKEKAEILADQLGVKLGRILYYNENGYPLYYGEGMGLGGGPAADVKSSAPARAQLPQGENKITSDITITYEIR